MDFEKKVAESYKRALRQGGGEGGFSQIVCPTTYEKPCKLCTLCYEILRDKSNQGTKLREQAYKLNQKHKYYSNVVFPGINPSTVVVLEYGDKIFGKLIGFQMDPNSDYKDWTHPVDGRNVFIKKIAGATKEQTSYDVVPRANKSKLIDINVLSKLHILEDILTLMKSGEVKPMYQSKLEMGDTEVRVLPSWLGPGSNMFFFPANFHYGVAEEEFNAIQAGDLNPFVTVIPIERPITSTPKSSEVLPPWETAKPNVGNVGWEELYKSSDKKAEAQHIDSSMQGPVVEARPPEGESLYPGCYGQYDEKEEECRTLCEVDGWAKSCQVITKELLDKKSKRIVAKRLSK